MRQGKHQQQHTFSLSLCLLTVITSSLMNTIADYYRSGRHVTRSSGKIDWVLSVLAHSPTSKPFRKWWPGEIMKCRRLIQVSTICQCSTAWFCRMIRCVVAILAISVEKCILSTGKPLFWGIINIMPKDCDNVSKNHSMLNSIIVESTPAIELHKSCHKPHR